MIFVFGKRRWIKNVEPKFPKPGLCGRGFNFSSGERGGGGLIKLNWNLLSVLYLQEKRGKIRYSKILSKLSPRISPHKQSAGDFFTALPQEFLSLCLQSVVFEKQYRSAARSFCVLQLIKLFVFSEFAISAFPMQSLKIETTFHYCWRVKSSFKPVWMESTSPCK